ncbi:endonuclease domain-containing protein [Sphingomonas sp. 1P06PA]|uniref:endonuclease domain-containing protein n=1 Tax=Sphingomonas sp. 1P06PA TaxID=554121 RepID=UPI0039A75267
MLHGPKITQWRARELRRAMSLPEVILWRALRERPAGLRFRRQHPAGRYILDFFCPAHRLAIEIDGEAHDRGDRPERDADRDRWLSEQGVRVIRVAARDVLGDLDAVVRHIESAALGTRYPSTSFAGPPPPPGEDF